MMKQQREDDDVIRGVAVIPFYSAVTNRLTRALLRRNIKTVSYLLIKIKQFMKSVKISEA